MRVDAYTHFIPKKLFDKVPEVAVDYADIGKRMRGVPALHDIEVRLKVMDRFPDYAQILAYPMPPIEVFARPDRLEELHRIVNDGLAELVAEYPDRFPGFVAQAPLAAPDAGIAEAERAINELGALGMQIYTNVRGKPLDRPEFEPFFAAMERLGKPIWIHPARAANHPDYLDEKKSYYEIWWALGWSYETTAAMARLVFSRMLDKYPKLKLVVHHFGGIAPMLEGRLGSGWDQLGVRTSDEDLEAVRKSLKKRPLDYFKQNFYADTAVFGSAPATLCGLAFYPLEKVLFASDCPFDPEQGPGYIRETLKIIDSLDLSRDDRDRIYCRNLEDLTGRKFAR